MIIYFLSYFALAVAIIGVVSLIIYIIRIFHNSSVPIVDSNSNHLTSNTDYIKSVSKKYGNRIRGSVRLSQGRIKSVDEIKNKESHICFP